MLMPCWPVVLAMGGSIHPLADLATLTAGPARHPLWHPFTIDSTVRRESAMPRIPGKTGLQRFSTASDALPAEGLLIRRLRVRAPRGPLASGPAILATMSLLSDAVNGGYQDRWPVFGRMASDRGSSRPRARFRRAARRRRAARSESWSSADWRGRASPGRRADSFRRAGSELRRSGGGHGNLTGPARRPVAIFVAPRWRRGSTRSAHAVRPKRCI